MLQIPTDLSKFGCLDGQIYRLFTLENVFASLIVKFTALLMFHKLRVLSFHRAFDFDADIQEQNFM
ncbi:hypothetical protein SLEP1_g59020 [Rubroshorea leprosula]|uniref:Uncharacterized protein n=1 Tax=Rubroshorea leprosula TaxID=152421 RepID=A0AAV5MSP3_9ROSI|nr:hypothetical protein SLEP1_g59020 [Rubroshorea leprosula]